MNKGHIDDITGGIKLHQKETISFEINLSKTRAYMIVESKDDKFSHAVFWNGSMILDSLYKEPQPIENYLILGIYPIMSTEQRGL